MPKLLVWKWSRSRLYLRRLHAILARPEAVISMQAKPWDWAVSKRLVRALCKNPGTVTREIMAGMNRLADLVDGVVDEEKCLLIRRDVLRDGEVAVAVVFIWVRVQKRWGVVVLLEEEFPLDDAYWADTVLLETEIKHRREVAAKGGAT